jgi:hypothetical protein
MFRLLFILFNVAVVTFLIYEMIRWSQISFSRTRKTMIIAGGVLLLLAPFGMFFGFFLPTLQYFIIYPVAISLYIYMIRNLLQ